MTVPNLQRISVLGGGAWGAALAQTCARAGRDVTLWEFDAANAQHLAEQRESRFLPGVRLDDTIAITRDLGQAAQVEAILLVVPAQAIVTGQRGTYVYVVDQADTARQRAVSVERTAGGLAIIASGVHEGDRVVTDGQSRLTPDSPVRLRGASDNGGGGGGMVGRSGRGRGGRGRGRNGGGGARGGGSPTS